MLLKNLQNMRNKYILLILTYLLQFSSVVAFDYKPSDSTNIQTSNTLFTGTILEETNNNKLYAYFGIPYAQPPVGELRWKAPRDVNEYEETRLAVERPNRCPQLAGTIDSIEEGFTVGEIIGSEDCLYLNIFVSEKAKNSETKLPVMVWIHGGSNVSGYGADVIYTDGDFALDHEIILVTINYRLGPFGWFYNSAININADNALDASGNYGTLDIIKSLEWVNKNISYFGGDEKNITIFGESAGARNINSLMISPLSERLFTKAISQSGYLVSDELITAENDYEVGSNTLLKALATSKNKKLEDQLAKKDFLYSLSVDEILNFYRRSVDQNNLVDVPNILPDGNVIPKEGLYKSFELKKMHDKPIIFGSTRDEEKLFMVFDEYFINRPLGFLSWLDSRFNFYIKPKDSQYYDIYSKYMTESTILGATHLPSRFSSLQNTSPVFAYRFDWDEEPGDWSFLIGAGHAMELGFLFKTKSLTEENKTSIAQLLYDPEKMDTDLQLANQMGKYWVNFAYDNDPNINPYEMNNKWLEWNSKMNEERFLVLDTTNDKGIVMYNAELSESSILQGLESENISNEKKCYVIDSLFERSGHGVVRTRTTLSNDQIIEIYNNFMNGKCKN
tara:strand:+ start:137 stop:1993 length:1857 start_codon:yes stop_codon:yes gene_type:complete